jgi:protocatechuate 3,4-dioxygenase beta subunit
MRKNGFHHYALRMTDVGRHMERLGQPSPKRREFLRLCCVMPATFVLAACAGQSASTAPSPAAAAPPASVPATSPPAATGVPPTQAPATQLAPTQIPSPTQPQAEPTAVAAAPALAPTPACGDDDDPTPAQTEGPYFTPNSPERASLLEPSVTGTKLVVTGVVSTTSCQPIPRALLDFWQADDAGAYDNTGYKLRGHQFTDDSGRYRLETIVPGLYPGRTRHIHVKVQPPNGAILTSQLYFPNEPRNQSDSIFDAALVMTVQGVADGKAATFDFVLEG